jgi:hypothetical protein
MHAPARFQERGVQAVGYSLYAVLAALALTALVGQAAAQSTPTPTPTVLVYCTPPPCQEGEVFYCPGECAGGCGTECATPTPTATPTDTPTPCSTGTPPSCPVGEFVSCDPNPCNGCHCEPCTPCPPGEAFIGCPGLVCPCTCAPAQGSVAAGFSVGLSNSTVDVPIALLLEPGVSLATLEFTLSVSSDGFEPLLSPISFQSAAALPTPDSVTSIGNDAVRVRWLAGFAPPLSGGLDLGILNVSLPVSSGFGNGGLYTVNVVDVSATNAYGSPLPLQGLGAAITRCTMIFFGLVTDAATGDGINGASVCFNSSRACVQTDPNGVYQELCYIGQSSGGTYMCATADGYEERCQGSWTPIGISIEVDFSLAAVTVPTPTHTPTATPGPEISITPSTLSLGCQGSFDITITNTGAPGTTLEITSLTLAHGYSEGFYGTGFSWGQVTLPVSLASGVTLTIPVDFYATGQWARSRLELTCDSNATNAPRLFATYIGGSQDACNTPTPTPTMLIVDHPTPTETSTPTPTVTGCAQLPTPGFGFSFSVKPAQPVVGDTVTLTFTVTGGSGLFNLWIDDQSILMGDTAPSTSNNEGSWTLAYHVTAVGAGTAHVALIVNFEYVFVCPDYTFYQWAPPVLSPLYGVQVQALPSPSAAATATVTPPPTSGCAGDCGGDGQVTVDEILTMVNIALGNVQVSTCEGGDADGDGQISIDEILRAVNNAMNGC